MSELDLVTVIKSLRMQLEEAMTVAENQTIQFEATSLELEFQVGVTSSVEATGGVKFWVVEMGGSGARSSETVQTVKLALSPKLAGGRPVKIAGATESNPLSSKD
jgi:hypothetical protein